MNELEKPAKTNGENVQKSDTDKQNNNQNHSALKVSLMPKPKYSN